MTTVRLRLLAIVLLLAVPLAAQQPAASAPLPQPSFSADSGAVMRIVGDLFQGMRKRDTTMMRAQFHPSAAMRSAANTRTGMVVSADQIGRAHV